jgi:Protein of unknown function (DUF2970)
MADVQDKPGATPLQVAKAVFWSFFGVRKRAEYEKDAVTLTLKQVVIAGIIGGIVFVLSLVMLVRFITR